MVNQSLPRPGRRWPATRSGPVLPKNHHPFAKSGDARNSFDCVTPLPLGPSAGSGIVIMLEAVTAFFGFMSAGIFIAHAVDGYRSRL